MRVINFKNVISFLVLASAIFFISSTMALSQPPVEPSGLDVAMEVQDAHTLALMGDREVVGTAVGLNSAGEPVGLLFAGSAFVTVANPIGPVLDEFGVTIDGE